MAVVDEPNIVESHDNKNRRVSCLNCGGRHDCCHCDGHHHHSERKIRSALRRALSDRVFRIVDHSQRYVNAIKNKSSHELASKSTSSENLTDHLGQAVMDLNDYQFKSKSRLF